MLKKYTLIVSILLLLMVPLFAETGLATALPGLNEEQYLQLLDGEILEATTINGQHILQLFVPGSVMYSKAVEAEKPNDGFSVAAVSYIPFPRSYEKLSTLDRQLKLFNTLRAISTQEGIEYISHRAGNKPKLLIERSSYMEDEKNLNKLLPDPVATAFPYSAQSYVYQRDTSFGGNRYLHTYTNSNREIFVAIENISSIKVLGLFTAVPKGKLKINMATYQLEDGVLMMGLTTIEDRKPEVKVLTISVDLPSAFMRRIRALQEWFVDQLNK
ncbi:MAG: DUF6675 family protein [Sphaerochaeta sp.]